jgi:hypothetical protein
MFLGTLVKRMVLEDRRLAPKGDLLYAWRRFTVKKLSRAMMIITNIMKTKEIRAWA